VGDWIVGLSPKAQGHRVVYAMQVDEVVPFEQYYRDGRFKSKLPDMDSKDVRCRCGDNICEPLPSGGFRQLRSMHSKDKGLEEDLKAKTRDLRGINALISWNFHYFGSDGPELPPKLNELKVGRAHKNRFSEDVVQKFAQFIAKQQKGICGQPNVWPKDDYSWKPGQKCG
jgi:hypothetical protein